MTTTKRQTNPQPEFDPSVLSFVEESYLEYKKELRSTGSKYDEKFLQVKIDVRMKCPKGSAARIATQLKKWLVRRGHKDPVVRSIMDCGDGLGGVWYMGSKEEEEVSQQRPPAVRSVATTLAPNAPWPKVARKAA